MLRKIAEIKVPTGAGDREAKTKPVFASYDRQGAAFAFYFSDSIIDGTKANLLFVIDGQKVFVDDDVTLTETNETHTFTYPLPDKLLNYTGKIDGYLYFDFEDGSHSDEIHFVFTIKKSKIDEEMEEAPDVYIKSFEEIKSDVKSKADQAKKDMQDNVDQVESDYQAWKETQEKKQTDFETDTNETIDGINTKVESAQTKVSDLEKNLDVEQKNYFSVENWKHRPEFTVTSSNMPAIKIKLESDEKYTLSSNIEAKSDGNANIFLTYGTRDTVDTPSSGVFPDAPKTLTTQSDGYVIVAIREDINVTDNDWWIMLNKGETAFKWTPASEDIVTKSELEQIKQAITNLGGSI